MREETFGSVRFVSGGGFPLSTDAVVLAAFARPARGSAVCDLGCGSGAVALQMLGRDPTLQLTGVEIDPEAVRAAQENCARNAGALRFSVLQGDLRQIRTLLPAGSFSYAVSNPPYFACGSGAAHATAARARSEETCSMEDLFAAADWLLPTGGRFALVHRPERLTDLLCTARAHALEPKRIRFVRHRPEAGLSLVLLECRKHSGAGLRFEPELLLHDAAGRETAEARAIYHKEAL